MLQPSGGVRKRNGGTMSKGLKKGSLVRHQKYGLCFIGGNSEANGLSFHDLASGARVHQDAHPNMKVLRFGSWRYRKAE